jgi:hypothetical protein
MFNKQTKTNVQSDKFSAMQHQSPRKCVVLNASTDYCLPANAVAVRVVSGVAWVATGKTNFDLSAGDQLDLTMIPGSVFMTSKGNRHVMLEMSFTS